MNRTSSYPPPLDRLFTFGEAEWGLPRKVPDYVAELGLTKEHVPALLDIASSWIDEDGVTDGPGDYAPIHAWRAMGQLRAIEAVEPLLNMQNQLDRENDDWYLNEFPDVFGMIGPPAIPALSAYLSNEANDDFPRISSADGLRQIGKRHLEARNEVVAALGNQMACAGENSYDLNGFLVSYLVDLKATEAAEAIERAFAAQVVEDDVCGTWGQVRQELGVAGLGLAPDTPPRPRQLGRSAGFGEPFIRFDPADRGYRRATEKKAKAKRKQQAKARKRNRKR